MSLSLRYAARSHVGLLRDGNEDSGYAGPRLLMIADGMGGAAGGEVASSVTVNTLAMLDEDASGGDFLDLLDNTIEEANARLRAVTVENPAYEGMGTTLTVLLWTGSRFGMAHIGDSRGYLLRDGVLEQITVDHTWVQRLIDEGKISEEEASHHPQRSLIMRALDGRDQIEPDLSVREARVGDRYLLCSDGLSGVVSLETMQATLNGYADRDQACEALIQLALRGGGPDNITCVIGDVVDGPDLGPAVPIVVGAAAERRAGPLPSYAAGGGPPPGASPLHDTSELPQTPAGRAALLRQRDDMPPDGPPFGEPGFGSPGLPPDDDGQRRRPRWRRPAILAGIAVILLAGLGTTGYLWSQQQYYVGVTSDGHIAIYRGLSQEIAGVHLSTVYERQNALATDLPQFLQSQLSGTISADSLADARRKAAQLDQEATMCANWRASQVGTGLGLTPLPSNTTPPAKPTTTPKPRATHGPGSTTPPTRPTATKPTTIGGGVAKSVPLVTPSPSITLTPPATTSIGPGDPAQFCGNGSGTG